MVIVTTSHLSETQDLFVDPGTTGKKDFRGEEDRDVLRSGEVRTRSYRTIDVSQNLESRPDPRR